MPVAPHAHTNYYCIFFIVFYLPYLLICLIVVAPFLVIIIMASVSDVRPVTAAAAASALARFLHSRGGVSLPLQLGASGEVGAGASVASHARAPPGVPLADETLAQLAVVRAELQLEAESAEAPR